LPILLKGNSIILKRFKKTREILIFSFFNYDSKKENVQVKKFQYFIEGFRKVQLID